MTASAPVLHSQRRSWAPAAVGIGTVVVFLLLAELLIQTGIINRFIVPPPSEIIGSFYRVVAQEHVFDAFCSPPVNA